MKVKFHLLRQATALAEHGSFSRAAESLNVSQPALSRGIKELEDQVGIALFNRNRSGNELTDFGRVFIQHAAELVSGAADLEREVALAKDLATGDLSVGMGPYVSETLGPICTAEFVAAHPGVRTKIVVDSPAAMARMLRNRTIDLMVGESSLVGPEEDLEAIEHLPPIPGCVLTRTHHPLRQRSKISMSDLLEFPFAQVVMLPPRVLKPILAARRSTRTRPSGPLPQFPAIECPTLDFAVKIIRSSDAFTFGALHTVRDELERGEVTPLLHEPWLRSEWAVLRLRRRTLSPAMTAFIETLRSSHTLLLQQEMELRSRWINGQASSAPAKKASSARGKRPTTGSAGRRGR
jgi:DNA-binding transcriptional LysR family regulator